jgi:hypothetical protein
MTDDKPKKLPTPGPRALFVTVSGLVIEGSATGAFKKSVADRRKEKAALKRGEKRSAAKKPKKGVTR